MSTLALAVFVVAVVVVLVLSLRRGSSSRSAADFSLAGRSLGSGDVAWVIIGTLVGGASTVGTVQMAVRHGMAAWYFTLGSGLACLVLALVFARPLREAEVTTVAEYLGRTFGEGFRRFTSLVTSVGMFVHIVAQYLAVMAILQAVLGLGLRPALVVTWLLHAVLVSAGGMAGASWLGKVKFGFLYVLMVVAAGLALHRAGGPSALLAAVPERERMLDLFAYGTSRGLLDLGAVVVGVLSTQTYLQALFAARDVRAARRGALLAAVLIPPVGLMGIVVGLHVRAALPALTGDSAQALPAFLSATLPPLVAALASAALLLIVLGTGAGLALGVTTSVDADLLAGSRLVPAGVSSLTRVRVTAVAVTTLAAAVVLVGLDSAILEWSYLSMGLRGAAILAGLVLVIFFPRLAGRRFVRPVLYALPVLYVAARLFGR